MKHIRQRKFECSLAAACMAHGKDYLALSDRWQQHHGLTFGSAAIVADGYRKPIVDFGREHKLSLFVQLWQTLWDIKESKTTEPRRVRVRWKLRGIIGIKYKRRGYLHGHVVAFCNGLVYDSDKIDPMPPALWKKSYPSNLKFFAVHYVEVNNDD